MADCEYYEGPCEECPYPLCWYAVPDGGALDDFYDYTYGDHDEEEQRGNAPERRHMKCLNIAAIAALACVCGCGTVDLGGKDLPVSVTELRTVPREGLTLVPGQNALVPCIAARAKVDLGKLDLPIQLQGPMDGWVIINAEPAKLPELLVPVPDK